MVTSSSMALLLGGMTPHLKAIAAPLFSAEELEKDLEPGQAMAASRVMENQAEKRAKQALPDGTQQAPPMTGAVKEALDRAEACLSHLALFQRFQACLPWWEHHGTPEVLHLLLQGIGAGQPLPPLLSLTERYKSPTEVQAATLILEGYQKEGEVKQLPGGVSNTWCPGLSFPSQKMG